MPSYIADDIQIDHSLAADGNLAEEAARQVWLTAHQIDQLQTLKQVHGNRVLRIDQVQSPVPEADGLWTTASGLSLGIVTADCLPIMLWQPGVFVAALHGGWRSLAGGIIGHLRDQLDTHNEFNPRQVRAWLGPCIHACCYEVGEEVAEAFGTEGGALTRDKLARKWRLDLPHVARTSITRWGVPALQIVDQSVCTRCRPGYHSHRRDGTAAGRMLNLIRRIG